MNGTYRQYLLRVITTLVIPQGYTLSIAGAFVAAVYHYGYPPFFETWEFVGGAVLAFVVLVLVGGHRGKELVPEMPLRSRALFNVVALGSLPLAAGACYAIPWRLLGFPAAGLIAAGGVRHSPCRLLQVSGGLREASIGDAGGRGGLQRRLSPRGGPLRAPNVSFGWR